MKTLVTGGDGFVGQHLLPLLLADGDDVCATMLGAAPSPGPLEPEQRAAVEWRSADVRDREALARLVAARRPDRIFHLAGVSSAAEAAGEPAEALRVNAEGTLHLVQATAEAGLDGARVVVAGSADAYGRGFGRPIAEPTPLRPESLYGATKAAQDVVARGAGQALGLDVRVARLFPLLGPGQREAFVLPSFCRRALAIVRANGAGELRVGNLDVRRDFTDVRDGARALLSLGGLDATSHRAYNVCSGRGLPVRRLLEWVLEAAGIDPPVVRDPALERAGEPESVVGDAGRLRAATGWRVERDLRDCAHECFQWMVSAGAA